MDFTKYYNQLHSAYSALHIESELDTNAVGEYQHTYRRLTDFRNAIHFLANNSEISDYMVDELQSIVGSKLYSYKSSVVGIPLTEYSAVNPALISLRGKLQVMIKSIESSKRFNAQDELYIKLPPVKTFEDLSKVANDFKLAIEIPIIDSNVDGTVEIVSADEGSIIFYIAVGSTAAVNLIAGICWAAAVLRKKFAEARMFEAHAKTLDLKNENLQILLDAQQQQWETLLSNEVGSIINQHYNSSIEANEELIKRLELSVKTTVELIDKGAQLIPTSNSKDIRKLFPDYGSLGLIESTIRQLKGE